MKQDSGNKTNFVIQLNGQPVNATSATNSHISEEIVNRLELPVTKTFACINLAVKGCFSQTIEACKATVELQQQKYLNFSFTVLKDLLTDVVLGQDFMNQHKAVSIHFVGTEPPLHLNVLKALKVTNPPLQFQYLTKDSRPIATKSRRHSNADCRFISTEIKRFLAEGIIEPSTSPWRGRL